MSVETFESMTPCDFLIAVRGHQWARERQAKDKGNLLVNIINTCGHLKKGKKVKMQDFYRDSHIDPRNPFYRDLLGI